MPKYIRVLVVVYCATMLVAGQLIEADTPNEDCEVLNSNYTRLFESEFQNMAGCIKQKIKKGIKILGIRISLDPLALPILPLWMNNDLLRGFMLLTKFQLEGLSDFVLTEGTFQLGHKITVKIKLDKISFSTKYSGRTTIFNMIDFYGNGLINFQLKNTDISVVVKTYLYPPLIRDVIFDNTLPKTLANITGLFNDHYKSGLVSEQLVDTLNTLAEEEQSRVNALLRDAALTFADLVINPFISDATLPDLINIIGGSAKECTPLLERALEDLVLKIAHVAGIDLKRAFSDYSKYRDISELDMPKILIAKSFLIANEKSEKQDDVVIDRGRTPSLGKSMTIRSSSSHWEI